MSKTFTIILSLTLTTLISSFSIPAWNTSDLIGIWVFKDYKNDTVEYVKSSQFLTDEAGIEFKKGGKLIKRQNKSWCGTPPIDYGNYKGSWKYGSDSVLNLKYKYWGGKTTANWQIIELNAQSLKMKYIKKISPN